MIKPDIHLIQKGTNIKLALNRLNELAKDAILFVVDDKNRLIGSLTDGDVRRGLLKGLSTENQVEEFIQENPKFIRKENYSISEVIELRLANFKVIPVLNAGDEIINIINFRKLKSYLPIDAVVMAGGRGARLKPMTDTVPKPLLKVGDKSIIDHNMDRLQQFGVDDFWISVRYLGDQIEAHFEKKDNGHVNINFVWEDMPLGTLGAVSKIKDFKHDYVLITNSDLLTNLDYEAFFIDFLQKDADMSVLSIPYDVKIPYAVMETENDQVKSFREKPTYTYYSNGGVYMVKREILESIPENEFYNSTDLMQSLINNKMKLISYPFRQYWLDIGRPEDFAQAQNDLKHIIK